MRPLVEHRIAYLRPPALEGGDEPAAGDPQDDVGLKTVVGGGLREFAARLTVDLPRQDLTVGRWRVQGSTDFSQVRICGVTGWVDAA